MPTKRKPTKPGPPGFIFRPYIKLRSGEVIFAKDYGLKAMRLTTCGPEARGSILSGEKLMGMLVCPLHMPVSVIEYIRFRFGRWEHVRAHCRSLPSR